MEKYHQLLLETVEGNIRRFDDKTAYSIGDEQVSYAQMNDMAESIAAYIAANLPASDNPDRPVRIGINLPRNGHFVPCMVATLKLGCAYVPIDPVTPAERKAYICEDSQLDLLITPDNLPQMLSTPHADTLPIYERPISEAYLIYTSGTTGKPKGVSQPYRSLYNYLQSVSLPDNFNISDKSTILQFASINFDFSILEIYSSLYCGATLVIAQNEDRYNAKRLHDLMVNAHITYCMLPPTLLSLFPDFNFPEMDTLSVGGEAVPHSLTQKMGGKYQYRFVNGYGPTETCIVVTTHEIAHEDDWRNIGKAIPGVVCYVANSEGKLVKPGEEGELLIGGMQLANGYWNRPDLNEKVFFENPYEKEHDGIDVSRLYHSGDLVILNEDGSVDYQGRSDSQIKLRGFRIEIREITTTIERYERVARAFVSLEQLNGEGVLVAYVNTKDKYPGLSDVREYVARYLPEYMVPTFWNYVEEFPLNINGKIDKTKLHNEALSTYTTNTTPLTPAEDMLMREAARILGVKEVNVECDLIHDLGFTSIQTMTLIADLNVVGFRMTMHDVAQFRSIRGILKNSTNADCYWYNDDETTTKPVIICVSGFTGFAYMYTQMMDRLKDDFSIFVLDCYHLIVGEDRLATADELMDLYTERIKSIVENHEVAFITGVCYGGEHALYLAHKLYKDKADKPIVICMDGEVDRDLTPEKNPTVYFPFFSDEINKHRMAQDDLILHTTPDFHYQGRIVSFICTEFVDCYSPLDPNPTELKVESMKDFLRTAPARWKARYPDCEIIMYPSNHDLFWRTEPSLTMTVDCFKREYEAKKNKAKA